MTEPNAVPILATETDANALVPARPPRENPYSVFLARLAPGSRPTMADALASIARIASGGRAGPEALPWHHLRYQHTQAIRQRLVETVSERTGKPLSPTIETARVRANMRVV